MLAIAVQTIPVSAHIRTRVHDDAVSVRHLDQRKVVAEPETDQFIGMNVVETSLGSNRVTAA
ncbi:MAG: hypothetical protein NTAFB01_28490 [Nitrospira sp.]